MESRKASPCWRVLIFFLTIALCGVKASSEEYHARAHKGPVVQKDQRRTLIDTEYGEISAIDIKNGHKELPYHLQFFTLEPNSLFLPVLLHADMVFYVHTGSGRLTWAHEDGTGTIDLRQGDLCSLSEGSVFYMQSNLESERRKLRIYAMFANTDDNTFDSSIGAYSRINELVRGFDKKIMQAAFKVPEDLIEAITKRTKTPAIVHAVSQKQNKVWELETWFMKNFLGVESNSKKLKTYNIFDNDPDFENRHGWTISVTKKQLKSLKRNNIGFFMVKLGEESILGPHWNPMATEVAVGVEGDGMVRTVCGSSSDEETECQNMRFKVKEGDVFVVPKFHPMAQMSFSNKPFVFMGFSTAAKKNHPQFLTGKGSVLEILDKQIVATSFGVSKRTIDQLLDSPEDSIIFRCSSCAEEEEKIMKEEEEERKKKEEEEDARKKEGEKEEEEAKRKEEARKREEEEAKREQEEREKRREEEEARKQKEEEKEEEEARKEREQKREEAAKREEEEARRKEKERKGEEEEAKREQEEREKRREEDEARKEKREEEARREQEKKHEEEEAERERKREEEKEKEEEEVRREEEEAKREQEAREKRREEEEEEEARRQKEQEESRREEEVRRKREERREKKRAEEEERKKEVSRREEEKKERSGEEEAEMEKESQREQEEEQAKRQQEEREKRREEEEGGSDNKFMERGIEELSKWSGFDGRRVLKTRYV